jgi:hypothetical protein
MNGDRDKLHFREARYVSDGLFAVWALIKVGRNTIEKIAGKPLLVQIVPCTDSSLTKFKRS